ncbi:MAG: nuclear transport factor 2 family protein [Betaproteobacteria bacterium]
MKKFARNVARLCTSCLILFATMPLYAREWSAAQKEVWKSVEAYWALDAAGNTDAFMTYFHADYVGWNLGNAMPGNKDVARKFIAHGHKTTKTLVYDIQPVAIKIHGNVAFVHYHYVQTIKDSSGKDKDTAGRWTDILMKQADKWVLIGDNGGKTSKD